MEQQDGRNTTTVGCRANPGLLMVMSEEINFYLNNKK